MRSSLLGRSASLICLTATASPVPQLKALYTEPKAPFPRHSPKRYKPSSANKLTYSSPARIHPPGHARSPSALDPATRSSPEGGPSSTACRERSSPWRRRRRRAGHWAGGGGTGAPAAAASLRPFPGPPVSSPTCAGGRAANDGALVGEELERRLGDGMGASPAVGWRVIRGERFRRWFRGSWEGEEGRPAASKGGRGRRNSELGSNLPPRLRRTALLR